ncbi:MAG: pilus assembly protein TadG-related protein [Planctomycetota bacterium]
MGAGVCRARVYVAGHQLQNAADSAALAGSRYVAVINEPTFPGWLDARLVARNYAAANEAVREAVNVQLNVDNSNSSVGGSGDDIVIGRYINPNVTYPNGYFDPADPNPDAMLVRTRKDGTSNGKLGLMFGRMFGVTERNNIQKYAIAKIFNPYGSGMIALGEGSDEPGVMFGGKGSEDALTILNGGSLQVNSSHPQAIDQTGNADPEVNFDRLQVVGGIDDKFDVPAETDLYDNLGEEGVVPDPYESVFDDLPTYDPVADDLGTINAPGTYNPGYYSGGILDPGGEVILLPGEYHLGGVGLEMHSSNTHIQGDNILLHIVETGNVNINGGEIEITGHTDYENISIFQDNDLDSLINGNNAMNIDGVVYTPYSLLELGGTGDGFGTRSIADRYLIRGNSMVVINYKGEPSIAQASYLVE